MRYVYVKVRPTPTCPIHGGAMQLIVPGDGRSAEANWRPYFACRHVPCRNYSRPELKDDLQAWDNPGTWKNVKVND